MIRFFARDVYKSKIVILLSIISFLAALLFPSFIYSGNSDNWDVKNIDRFYKLVIMGILAFSALPTIVVVISIFNYRERYDLLLFSMKYTRRKIFFNKLLVIFLQILLSSFFIVVFMVIGSLLFTPSEVSSGIGVDGGFRGISWPIVYIIRLTTYIFLLNFTLALIIIPFAFIRKSITIMMTGILVVLGFLGLSLISSIQTTTSYNTIVAEGTEETSLQDLDQINQDVSDFLEDGNSNFLPKYTEMSDAINDMETAIYGTNGIGQVSRRKNGADSWLLPYFNLPAVTYSLIDNPYLTIENSVASSTIKNIDDGKIMAPSDSKLNSNSFAAIENELGKRFGALSEALDKYDSLLNEASASITGDKTGVEDAISILSNFFGNVLSHEIFNTRNSSGKLLGQIDILLTNPDAIVDSNGNVITIGNDNIQRAYLTLLNIAAHNTSWVEDIESKYLVSPLYQYLIFALIISGLITWAYFRHEKLLVK